MVQSGEPGGGAQKEGQKSEPFQRCTLHCSHHVLLRTAAAHLLELACDAILHMMLHQAALNNASHLDMYTGEKRKSID